MNNDGFTKLFSSIIQSSIWSEDDKTRIMWVTILALCDAAGMVQGSIPGLAAAARMTNGDAQKAVERLEAPDPYSSTPDNEGRRIEKCDGGWIVLNFRKYRDRDRAEKRREYMANLMASKRLGVSAVDVLTDANNMLTLANSKLTSANASASVSVSVSDSGNTIHGQSAKARRQKTGRVAENTPLMMRVGAMMGRRPETLWSVAEADLLKQLKDIPEDELVVMDEYYSAKIPKDQDYRRTCVERLLKYWTEELDKANTWKWKNGGR